MFISIIRVKRNMKRFVILLAVFLSVLLCAFSVSATEITKEEYTTAEHEYKDEQTTYDEESTKENAEEVTEVTTEEVAEETTEETIEETTEEPVEETTEALTGTPVVLGDIDGDSAVTAQDARKILRFSVGFNEIEGKMLPLGDTNADSVITSADARTALRISVSLEKAVIHYYNIDIVSESSCSKHGKLSFYCSDCENSGEISLPLTEHNLRTGKFRIATCKNEGYTIKKCSKCSYETKTTTAKTEHIFLAATRTKPKTCLVCSKAITGWTQVDSVYCYFYKSGNKVIRAENCVVDGYYIDSTGARCDDTVINTALSFVNKNSKASDNKLDRLKACYNYLYKYYSYKSSYGTPVAADFSRYASELFSSKMGNCYKFASAISYIGRVLGYDTRVVTGKVRGVYGDMVNHSYAEILVDGKWYICDATQNKAYPRLNWFLISPSSYHKAFNRGIVYTLTVSDGKVLWD